MGKQIFFLNENVRVIFILKK